MIMPNYRIPVSIYADRYSGPVYVKLHLGIVGKSPHHAKVTAAMRRLVREVWGDKADVIRLTPCTYEAVWVGLDTPSPEFLGDRARGAWDGEVLI